MKIKNRIISLILVVLVLMSITLFSVSAVSSDQYDGFVVSLYKSDKEYKITGYNGDKTDLSTPYMYNSKYFTLIDNGAFSDNDSITSIKINKYIMSIGEYAFFDCSNLVSVNLDESVKSIGDSAFKQCDKLSSITILNKEATFGSEVFKSSSKVVINCYKDSTAETYAKTNNISYVLIDDPQPTTEPTTEPTTQPTTEPVTETVTPTEPIKDTYVVGDGNDNGHVDISDATIVQLLLANLMVDDGFVSQRAYFVEEGKSITNATYLQMNLAKITTPYDNIIGTTRDYTKK